MKVSQNQRAIALYSGSIGAFLESSVSHSDQGYDTAHLEQCRIWLIQNNSLFCQYDVRSELQIQPLPTVELIDSSTKETRPTARPEVVMNPFEYPSETRNEDYRYHRLPVAQLQNAMGLNVSVMRSDPELELMLFPVLYPWGKGQWIRRPASQRVRGKDTLMQDCRIKLNSIISHYRDDHFWPAWIYMEIEAIRLFQNNQRLISGQIKRSLDGRLPVSELLQCSAYGNWSIVNEKITTTIPRFIRTGEAFFIDAESKIKAMLREYGIPILFVTLTFSEKWPQYQHLLKNSRNGDTLPSNRPWDAVQYYYERLYWLRKEFLRKPGMSMFGCLLEVVERHKFQQCGAIHSHCLLWTESKQDKLLSDHFIRADVPDPLKEPELYSLVVKHQIHNCDPEYCGGPLPNDGPCRKGFPTPLAEYTHVQSGELRYRYAQKKEEDRHVVPYNARLLLIWKAHCNIQYCTTGGLANYVSKYVTKSEPKSIVSINSQDHVTSHLEARQIGSMEMMVLLLGHPIFLMTSACIYLPMAPPELRSATVKPPWMLEEDPENPYFDDALEKYYN